MRKNYKQLAGRLQSGRPLNQDEKVNFRIYFSSWLGYLYATHEGFLELHTDMPTLLTEGRPASFVEVVPKWQEIARLIKHRNHQFKKLRNNVFHTSTNATHLVS